ncbi:MAG: tetratricopeptide repeat protein [Campylobacteraceae bacterium]
MRLFMKFFISLICIVFFSGCAQKLEIYSLSDNAFVDTPEAVLIQSDTIFFPMFTSAVIDELTNQVIKDGFSVNPYDFTYVIKLKTLENRQVAHRQYEPVYRYYRYCDANGYCYVVPRVYYVPCVDIMSSTVIGVNAVNIKTSQEINFVVNNKDFAGDCNSFRSSYYDYPYWGSYYYPDRFLLEGLSRENLRKITTKIKNSIFPIRTETKEKLYSKIESQKVSSDINVAFENSLNSVKNKDLQNATKPLINIKNVLHVNTPFEVYYNLGLIYEKLGNLSLAYENYLLLDDNNENKTKFLNRILGKMKYEK